jgi:hypothetical protein
MLGWPAAAPAGPTPRDDQQPVRAIGGEVHGALQGRVELIDRPLAQAFETTVPIEQRYITKRVLGAELARSRTGTGVQRASFAVRQALN